MTNKKFNKLMMRLAKANMKYKDLLNESEDEFKRRYGEYHSDIDFDSWIDTYHVGRGYISAEEIDEEYIDRESGGLNKVV